MSSIDKSTLTFLKDLSKNNNREWFTENKKDYDRSHANMCDFMDDVLSKLNVHDEIETPSGKKSLFRIYRDVRFSKDKTPYNPRFAGGFKRAGASRRGGYYFHFSPDSVMVGVGFWAPNKEDLARIRYDIAEFHEDWRRLLDRKEIKSTFGEMIGEQLKTAPKGFDKTHPAIDLIRKKQFLLTRSFSDKEVLAPNFQEEVLATFQEMRPCFDYMSEVLSTDLNGESLYN